MRRERYKKCRHFTGVQNKTCKEGVAYADVRDETTRPYGFPCLDKGGTCDKKSLLTDAEEDARDKEIAQRIASIGEARAAIVEHGKSSGRIPCPCCEGGTLGYSKAASNGHIHAACSTPGCVRWME